MRIFRLPSRWCRPSHSILVGVHPPAIPVVIALVLLMAAATEARAQSASPPPPVVAAPTATDLELYALARDSAASPDEEVTVLLDEGRVRVEEDGRTTATFRSVRQVWSQDAVRAAAEVSLGYDGGRETLELDWARVVKVEGEVVSGPVHLEELDAPVARGSPVYTDVRLLRGSLGGVEPGRIVDVQYTRAVTDPILAGDLLQGWSVNSTHPVLRSRFVLDTPAGMELRIRERNLPAPARVVREGDRVVREWSYEELEAIEPEPFAADSNDVAMSLVVSGPRSWDDVARWYDSLSAGRYAVTPEVEAAVAVRVGGATTLKDSLRAVHRWIAQDIRYVSISLGIGGYLPRTPEEVVRSGVGDCKDKATLFVAIARWMGAEANPVLVRRSGPVDLELVSPRQFNHMIAAVRLGGEWRYLDLTVPFAPFDELFGPLQGSNGIMLHPDGRASVVEFPIAPAERNRSLIRIEGELHPDGTLNAEYLEEVTGAIQYRIRSEFDQPLDERMKESVRRNLGNRVARGGQVDSMALFDGLDLDTTPRLWARVQVEDVLQPAGDAMLLPLRLAEYATPAMIQRLETHGERRFPIDAEEVFGRREHRTVYRILLPPGWVAELPEDVRAESAFGFYESVYEQDGRELSIVRVIRGTDGVLPPSSREELLSWFRTMAADHVEHIVLRR